MIRYATWRSLAAAVINRYVQEMFFSTFRSNWCDWPFKIPK